MDDYLPLETEVTFSPDQQNKTHCVIVTVLDDRLVEREERFDIVLTTEGTGVELAEDRRRATVVITDEDGKSMNYKNLIDVLAEYFSQGALTCTVKLPKLLCIGAENLVPQDTSVHLGLFI